MTAVEGNENLSLLRCYKTTIAQGLRTHFLTDFAFCVGDSLPNFGTDSAISLYRLVWGKVFWVKPQLNSEN